MRRWLLAGALALAAAVPARADDTQWYMLHVGAAPCVPLTDIGEHGERLYYHAGLMQTPEDFAALLERQGMTAWPYPTGGENLVGYYVSLPQGTKTVMLMVRGKEHCRHFMDALEK